MNANIKLTLKKAYGFRTFEAVEVALYHQLGKLPEPPLTPDSSEEPEKQLGIVLKDFVFTGTTFSSVSQLEVAKRYRFGRLWITQAYYQVDGTKVRYADLVGVEGKDEEDGGPPNSCRYVYKDTGPYLLPSMEIQALIYETDKFRAYLEDALPH